MRIAVASVKIHPMYRFRNNAYDVGLLKLEGPALDFSADLLPVCLEKINTTKNNTCQKDTNLNETVVGLGGLEGLDIFSTKNSLPTSERMDPISNEECENAGKVAFAQDMFCASSKDNLLSGDSGSPFLIMWENRVHIMGIYSWGQRTVHTCPYDYFTNVQPNYNFISETMKRG